MTLDVFLNVCGCPDVQIRDVRTCWMQKYDPSRPINGRYNVLKFYVHLSCYKPYVLVDVERVG